MIKPKRRYSEAVGTLRDHSMGMQAHGDTAREEAQRHMRNAADALAVGEDENAEANILDALLLMGRAEAFYQAAKEALDPDGDD